MNGIGRPVSGLVLRKRSLSLSGPDASAAMKLNNTRTRTGWRGGVPVQFLAAPALTNALPLAISPFATYGRPTCSRKFYLFAGIASPSSYRHDARRTSSYLVRGIMGWVSRRWVTLAATCAIRQSMAAESKEAIARSGRQSQFCAARALHTASHDLSEVLAFAVRAVWRFCGSRVSVMFKHEVARRSPFLSTDASSPAARGETGSVRAAAPARGFTTTPTLQRSTLALACVATCPHSTSYERLDAGRTWRELM